MKRSRRGEKWRTLVWKWSAKGENDDSSENWLLMTKKGDKCSLHLQVYLSRQAELISPNKIKRRQKTTYCSFMCSIWLDASFCSFRTKLLFCTTNWNRRKWLVALASLSWRRAETFFHCPYLATEALSFAQRARRINCNQQRRCFIRLKTSLNIHSIMHIRVRNSIHFGIASKVAPKYSSWLFSYNLQYIGREQQLRSNHRSQHRTKGLKLTKDRSLLITN